MKRITKAKTHPNPPTAVEINKARKIVQEILPEMFPSLDKEPIPSVMESWAGQGWHRHDVFVGILIGLEIAKARKDRSDEKKLSNRI